MGDELWINVMDNQKIVTFTDLNAWKQGHQLALEVYKLTRSFPKEELYSLVDQLRRAAVSITSNIAEGFSRQSYKEKVQFYSTAMGSTTEVQSQLLLAKDLGYINIGQFNLISEIALTTHKLLSGLIKSSKSRIA